MAGSPIRLRKVASDLNVGTATIVDFLNKKGHKLEDNPNTKIPEELYDLLVKEFSKDQAAKRDAEKISIGVQKTVLSIEDTPKKEEEDDISWEKRDKDIHIKSLLLNDSFSTASQNKEVIETTDEPETIPAAAAATTKKDEKQDVKEKSKKTIKKAAKEKDVSESVTPIQPDEVTLEEQSTANITDSIAVAEPEKQQVVEEGKQEIINEPITETPSVSALEVEQPTDTNEKAMLVEESSSEEGQAQEDTIKLQPKGISIKVVGKIDLDSIQPKPKHDSVSEKSEEERKKERNAAKKAKKKAKKAADKASKEEEVKVQESHVEPVVEKTTVKETETPKKPEAPKKDDNLIPTEYEKLAGPTVVGKIDLSQFERKPSKPIASSSGDISKQNKKKRKRIKDGAPVTAEGGKSFTSQKPQGKNQGNAKKDNTQSGNAGSSSRPKPDFNKDRDKNKKKTGSKKKEVVKVELTDEEIQRQVRETLSKLTASTKSKGAKYRREKRNIVHQQLAEQQRQAEEEEKILKVTEFLTANELATMMNIPVNKIIAMCMSLGLFVSINQRLGAETIQIVAEELGFKVKFIDQSQHDETVEVPDKEEDLKPRHPVVTVMGHVDHGKTKLLDYIRRANVVAGEAGGITQHIGAYSVQLESGRKITFLDTPGHEAFTAMRARGAKLTDIAIIVIAADDCVMPQTKEAINHAQAAGVPIVFAINKIDKPTADPDKVRTELSQMNILVEEWGGKYQCQEISAKQGINVDKLLEKVLLEAEMLELRANPTRLAKGTVIESKLEHGRGYVSSVLIQNGTLRKGDMVLCGAHFGKVKAMFNEREQLMEEAGPATPVLMVGLNGAPQAGETFSVYEDEGEAKRLAIKHQQLQREMSFRTQKHITLDEIGRRIAIGDFKELNIIVKADVDGSVEALSDSLLKLSKEEVQVNVIHKGVGAIIESDVVLASASNAIIIGFQVRPTHDAKKMAENEQIDIRIYNVIYEAIEELEAAIEGMLTPKMKEEIVCNVEVREIFKISKVGTIAGCMVLEGVITRDTKIRVIRDGIVIHNGVLGSLKRFKDDVKDAKMGQECGLNIASYNDIQIGDIIEGYKEVQVKK